MKFIFSKDFLLKFFIVNCYTINTLAFATSYSYDLTHIKSNRYLSPETAFNNKGYNKFILKFAESIGNLKSRIDFSSNNLDFNDIIKAILKELNHLNKDHNYSTITDTNCIYITENKDVSKSQYVYQITNNKEKVALNNKVIWQENIAGFTINVYKNDKNLSNLLQNTKQNKNNFNYYELFDTEKIIQQLIDTENMEFALFLLNIVKLKIDKFNLKQSEIDNIYQKLEELLTNNKINQKVLDNINLELISILESHLQKTIRSQQSKTAKKLISLYEDLSQPSLTRELIFKILSDLYKNEFAKSKSKDKFQIKAGKFFKETALDKTLSAEIRNEALDIIFDYSKTLFSKSKTGSKVNKALRLFLQEVAGDETFDQEIRTEAIKLTGDFQFKTILNDNYQKEQETEILAEISLNSFETTINSFETGYDKDSSSKTLNLALMNFRKLSNCMQFNASLKILKNSQHIFQVSKNNGQLEIYIDQSVFHSQEADKKIAFLLFLSQSLNESGKDELLRAYLKFAFLFKITSKLDSFEPDIFYADTLSITAYFKKLDQMMNLKSEEIMEDVFEFVANQDDQFAMEEFADLIRLKIVEATTILIKAHLSHGYVNMASEILNSFVYPKGKKEISIDGFSSKVEDENIKTELNKLKQELLFIEKLTQDFKKLSFSSPLEEKINFYKTALKVYPQNEYFHYSLASTYISNAKELRKNNRTFREYNQYIEKSEQIATNMQKTSSYSSLALMIQGEINLFMFEERKEINLDVLSSINPQLPDESLPSYAKTLPKNKISNSSIIDNTNKQYKLKDFDHFFKALETAIKRSNLDEFNMSFDFFWNYYVTAVSEGKIETETTNIILKKLIEYSIQMEGFKNIQAYFITAYEGLLLDKNTDAAKELADKFIPFVEEKFSKELAEFFSILSKTRALHLSCIADAQPDPKIMEQYKNGYEQIINIFKENYKKEEFQNLDVIQKIFSFYEIIHVMHDHLLLKESPNEAFFAKIALDEMKKREGYIEKELVPVHENLIKARVFMNSLVEFTNEDIENNIAPARILADEAKKSYLNAFDKSFNLIVEKINYYNKAKDNSLKADLQSRAEMITNDTSTIIQNTLKSFSAMKTYPTLIMELNNLLVKKAKKEHHLRYYHMTLLLLFGELMSPTGEYEEFESNKLLLDALNHTDELIKKMNTLSLQIYDPSYESIEATIIGFRSLKAKLHEKAALMSNNYAESKDHLNQAKEIYQKLNNATVRLHLPSNKANKVKLSKENYPPQGIQKQVNDGFVRINNAFKDLEEKKKKMEEAAKKAEYENLIEKIKNGEGLEAEVKENILKPLQAIKTKNLNNAPVKTNLALKELTNFKDGELAKEYTPWIEEGYQIVFDYIMNYYEEIVDKSGPKALKIYQAFNEMVKFDSALFLKQIKDDQMKNFLITGLKKEIGMLEFEGPNSSKSKKKKGKKKQVIPMIKKKEDLGFIIPFFKSIGIGDLRLEVTDIFNFIKTQTWFPKNFEQLLNQAINSLEKDLYHEEISKYLSHKDKAIFLNQEQAEELIENEIIDHPSSVVAILENKEVEFFYNRYKTSEEHYIPKDQVKAIIDSARVEFATKEHKNLSGKENSAQAIRKLENLLNNAHKLHIEINKQRKNSFHAYAPWNNLIDAIYFINSDSEEKVIDFNLFEGSFKGKGNQTKWDLAAAKILAYEISYLSKNSDFQDLYSDQEWKTLIKEGKEEGLNWKEFIIEKVFAANYSNSQFSLLSDEEMQTVIETAKKEALRKPVAKTLSKAEFFEIVREAEVEKLMNMIFWETSLIENERLFSQIKQSIDHLTERYQQSDAEKKGYGLYLARKIFMQIYPNKILLENENPEYDIEKRLSDFDSYDQFNQEDLNKVILEQEISYIQSRYPHLDEEFLKDYISKINETDISKEQIKDELRKKNLEKMLKITQEELYQKYPVIKEIIETNEDSKALVNFMINEFVESFEQEENELSIEIKKYLTEKSELTDELVIDFFEQFYLDLLVDYLFIENIINLPKTLIKDKLTKDGYQNLTLKDITQYFNTYLKDLPSGLKIRINKGITDRLSFDLDGKILPEKLNEFIESETTKILLKEIMEYAFKENLLSLKEFSPIDIIDEDLDQLKIENTITQFNQQYQGKFYLTYKGNDSKLVITTSNKATPEELQNFFINDNFGLGLLPAVIDLVGQKDIKYRFNNQTKDEDVSAYLSESFNRVLSDHSKKQQADEDSKEQIQISRQRTDDSFDIFFPYLLNLTKEIFPEEEIIDLSQRLITEVNEDNQMLSLIRSYLKPEFLENIVNLENILIAKIVEAAQEVGIKTNTDSQLEVTNKIAKYIKEGEIFTFFSDISKELNNNIKIRTKKSGDYDINQVIFPFLRDLLSFLEHHEQQRIDDLVNHPDTEEKISA